MITDEAVGLVDLLARLSSERRLAAQGQIPRDDMLRMGDDSKRIMRGKLARSLAEHMMEVGEIERVFSAPRIDEPHPFEGGEFFEQWDVEMVVMTRSEFRALNDLCLALVREVKGLRSLPHMESE